MSKSRVCVPCEGVISNHFGEDGPYGNPWKTHIGIDVAAPEGTPVVASRSGVVVWAAESGALGNCVIVNHQGDSRSLYSHLAEMSAEVGDMVDLGEQIGAVGSTGFSTGPHLHFEVWVACDSVDDSDGVWSLTRNDPGALPADPFMVWDGHWPINEDGLHTPGYQGG